MTTNDGTVLGMTQVAGTAPRNHAFNIIMLAEGFTATEQNAFDQAVDDFVAALKATPPYTGLMSMINVFRVNVASTDSGADDPVATGGTGATPNTYFDATFGLGGVQRALGCNDATVLQVAAQQLPEFTLVLVVVNSTIYGGTGGSVGTYSLAAGATEIAIHEAGHTAYALADEYAYLAGGSETGHDVYPGGEPTEPNVTANTDRATLKWGAFVSATTALPTMSNPNCGTEDTRPSTVPAGTAGCFEGARYFHCGAFRPEYNCKMRQLGVPFCQVCTSVIVARIQQLGGPTWQHFDLTISSGDANVTGNPRGYVFAEEKRQHVIARATDGNIHELAISLGGTKWGHFDLTAGAGAPAAAGDPMGYVFDEERRQHVLYRGVDGHIHELAISLGGTKWGHFDLTAGTGAPATAGDPAGYVFAAEKRQHVVYRTADGHVHELAISLGGSAWADFDLTAGTGAPAAAGDPMGYVFTQEKRQHVVYRSVDGHVHELAISLGGTKWGHFDLTAGTGAPAAAGDPMGYVFDEEHRQHVLYRGVDGHIHELANSLGETKWAHFDLTAGTGAPAAAGDPMGYVFDEERRQHVLYRGVDGHIHELANSLGETTWGHFDLTATTSGPSAVGDPTGYVFVDEHRQHVLYAGADGHIHELAISRP